MLNSLKEKLINSIKENVLQGDPKTSRPINSEINFNAGGQILKHFQEEWCELHKNNEENAKGVHSVVDYVNKISEKIETDKKSIALIEDILTNSKLNNNIQQCTVQIKQLHFSFEQVEKNLVILENLIDQVEFNNMKKRHKYHLELFKIKKQEQLDQLKTKLENEYQEAIKAHEESSKKMLEERQKVFQEAFKSDLEVYKTLGTIPKIDLAEKHNSPLLEEIQLDYNQDELDQFFEEKT